MRSPSSAARVPAAFLLLCAVVIQSACSGSEAAQAQAKGPEKGELKRREPTRVRVVPVEQREMVRVLQTTTVVESEKEIQVFPRASGIVVEINADEGDQVEAGQVLAVLDQREAKAMLEQARVAVSEAKDAIERSDIAQREALSRIEQTRIAWEQAVRDYDRNEKAALISEQALDALRTARDSRANDHDSAKLAHSRSQVEAKAAHTSAEKARLSLERAELELSYTRIEAPFAGIIASRGVRVGGTVGRGTSVIETAGAAFVLTDHQNLRAVFHRPQRELAWFTDAFAAAGGKTGGVPGAKPSLEIRVHAEALPGRVFRGEIQRVSPSIDPQSGSFRVTVRLEPAASDAGPGRLLPGMLVRLEVVTDRHPEALAVPKRSLRREGEVDSVFLVEAGHVRRVEVEEGFSDETHVEVKPCKGGKIAKGDRVVIVGNRDLEDGIEAIADEEPGAAVTPTPEPIEAATAPAAGSQG
jgi:RND family efflux transporter MFP subunit